MAPFIAVQSLYTLCLKQVLSWLKEFNKCNNKDAVYSLRDLLIVMLNGNIRNHLIEKAFNDSCFLNIVSILGDSTIKRLHLVQPDNWFFVKPEGFFSVLDENDITGLHELTARVVQSNRDIDSNCSYNWSKKRPSSLSSLHRALDGGLAENLRVLVLSSSVDNRVLEIIGKKAVHLTNLDLSYSWLVDDSGISKLLFQDPSGMDVLPWQKLELCDKYAIDDFSFISDSKLNRCCSTLNEVKIQHTNTSSVSLILLLMFVKNLKSLGGFLYSRNIGDAILLVTGSTGGPKFLSLTELWDTTLSTSKLDKLSHVLPGLSHLYTRLNCLPCEDSPIFLPLTQLTLDLDFNVFNNPLYVFLFQCCGPTLKRLVLIDQVVPVELLSLAIACPMLEHIIAKVYIGNEDVQVSLPYLTSAKLGFTKPQQFLWVMKNANKLEDLEVQLYCERNQDLQDPELSFDTEIINQLLEEKPESLKTIKQLSLNLVASGIVNYNISLGSLYIESAYQLCLACDRLSLIGELDTWYHVSLNDVKKMVQCIKKSNWDVQLRYKGNLYPNS